MPSIACWERVRFRRPASRRARAIPPGRLVRLLWCALAPPDGVPDPRRREDGAVPGRIAGNWGCAARWSAGNALPGTLRWHGTDRERIRLAASQTPTIPLKLNTTD